MAKVKSRNFFYPPTRSVCSQFRTPGALFPESCLIVSHDEMPLLRLQLFTASSHIAKTDLAEVEAAFDEDIKTLEAASSTRNVTATASQRTAATDSPGFRPELECMPVLSFCLSFFDMGPIFTDRETIQSVLHIFEFNLPAIAPALIWMFHQPCLNTHTIKIRSNAS